MASETPTYRLAKVLLGMEPRTFIQERRDRGESFRTIARSIWLATDHEIDVSDMTVRTWVKNGDAA